MSENVFEPGSESGVEPPHSKGWAHAPRHDLTEKGAYIVTAGTMRREHFFCGDERLDLLRETVMEACAEFGWNLQAWAFFSNHYHIVAVCEGDPNSLRKVVSKAHTLTAKYVNRLDGTDGRKVWFQFWDTHISFHRSYLARLNYVHYNPVKHGLVADARQYRWCSAAWFEQTANTVFLKTVQSFKTDSVNVRDDF